MNPHADFSWLTCAVLTQVSGDPVHRGPLQRGPTEEHGHTF